MALLVVLQSFFEENGIFRQAVASFCGGQQKDIDVEKDSKAGRLEERKMQLTRKAFFLRKTEGRVPRRQLHGTKKNVASHGTESESFEERRHKIK